jgi:phage recombination protein Bet
MSTLQHYEDTEDFSKQLELWTRTYMKGATADEVALFANVCRRTGLSPEMKQIYPVPREDKRTGITSFSFQTSIDGFRLIAERTGRYAPGQQATYEYETQEGIGKPTTRQYADRILISATAYVKKMTNDGTWHEVAATAFYDEYVQEFKDKESGKFIATKFWLRMPHVMLAKCAESLALRKAFPAELSGLYTQEEMAQATIEEKPKNETITQEQAQEIEELLKPLSIDYIEKLLEWAQVRDFNNLPAAKYEAVLKSINKQLATVEAK